MFGNLLKAAIAVSLTPVAFVADVMTLPASAFRDDHPFGMTGALLKAAGENVSKAVAMGAENEP